MAITYNEITESLDVPTFLKIHKCTICDLKYDLDERYDSGAVVEKYIPSRIVRNVPCTALGVGASPSIQAEQEGQMSNQTFYFGQDYKIQPKCVIMFRGDLYDVTSVFNPENLNVMWVVNTMRRDIVTVQARALVKYILDTAAEAVT
jgi:hypothetical protein